MASVSWQRLIPSSGVWQSEQRDRLDTPASVASRLSSSSVHCSTLKGKSSEHFSIQKRVWHWRAGAAERGPVSVFACGWLWSKMPGAGAQGQPSHQNGLFGLWLPFISSCHGPAPDPTTPSLLQRCHGTELQKCRWAAERAVQQSLSLFSSCRMKLFRQKAGFVPSYTERNRDSYFSPHLPTPAPKFLGCTMYIHVSHKSFIPWVASLAFSHIHWENTSLKIFFFSREEVFG